MKPLSVKSFIVAFLAAVMMLFCACNEVNMDDIGAKADMLFITQKGEGIGEFILDTPVSSDKQWRLWCGAEIDISKLTGDDISVKDDEGNSVSVSVMISEDGSVLSLGAPDGGYVAGKSYSVSLREGTALEKGKTLKNDSILHFYIESADECKIAPEKVTVSAGSSVKFNCENAREWYVSGYNSGTVSESGVYTAPSQPGEYTVFARCETDGGDTYSYAIVTVEEREGKSDLSVGMEYTLSGNVLTVTAKTYATVCENAAITTLNVYVNGELYDVRPVTVLAGESEGTQSVIKYVISDDERMTGKLAVKCELGEIHDVVDENTENNGAEIILELEKAETDEHNVNWTAPWAEPYDTQTVVNTYFAGETWQGVIGASGTLKGSLGFSDYNIGVYNEVKAQMYVDGKLYSSKVYKYTAKAGGHGENIPFEYYVPYISKQIAFSMTLSNGKSLDTSLPVVQREMYLAENCLYIGEGAVNSGEKVTLCADVYTNMPNGYAKFEGVAVKLYVNGKYMGTQLADKYPYTTLSVKYTVEDENEICFSAVVDPYSQLGNGTGESVVRVFDKGSTADMEKTEIDNIKGAGYARVEITDMRILRGAVTGGESSSVTLFITNNGTADCENVPVTLYFGDEVLANDTVSVAAGKSIQKTVQIIIPEWTTGEEKPVKYSLGSENGDKIKITAWLGEGAELSTFSEYYPLTESGKGTLTVKTQSTFGAGVSDVDITLVGEAFSVKAKADECGVVTFYNLPFGSYTVTASHEQYTPTKTAVTLTNSRPVTVVTADIVRNGLLADLSGYDTDKDLLSNSYEELIGTKKKAIDSDGDGVYDGYDISPLIYPAQPDYYRINWAHTVSLDSYGEISTLGLSVSMKQDGKQIMQTVPVADMNALKTYINEYLAKINAVYRIDGIALKENSDLHMSDTVTSKVIKDKTGKGDTALTLQLVKNDYVIDGATVVAPIDDNEKTPFYYTALQLALVPEKDMELTLQLTSLDVSKSEGNAPYMMYRIYSDSDMNERSLIKQGQSPMTFDTVSAYSVKIPVEATQLDTAYVKLIPVWVSKTASGDEGYGIGAMAPSFRITAITRTLLLSQNKETGDTVCITEQLCGMSALAEPFADEQRLLTLKTEQDELVEGEIANENAYKTEETVYAVAYMPNAEKPYLFMQRSISAVNERIYEGDTLEKVVQLKKVQSLETTVDIEMYDPDGMWKAHWTKENRFKSAFADFKQMKTPCVLYCNDEDVWLCYSDGETAKIHFYGADMSGKTKYRVLTSVSGFSCGENAFIANDNLPSMLGASLKTATLLASFEKGSDKHITAKTAENAMIESAADIFGSKLLMHLGVDKNTVEDWNLYRHFSYNSHIYIDLEPIKSYNKMSMLPVSAAEGLAEPNVKTYYTWLLSDVSEQLTAQLSQYEDVLSLPYVTVG